MRHFEVSVERMNRHVLELTNFLVCDKWVAKLPVSFCWAVSLLHYPSAYLEVNKLVEQNERGTPN